MPMRPAGEAIDRYVLETFLGNGGTGEVYAARDTRLGRRVALKLLRGDADSSATARMIREARAAAAFEHPNAVVIFDVGAVDGIPYIAMELVRGRSLRTYVGDRSVSLGRRLRWLVDIARALAAAHRSQLIHRDVKPDNVMLREDGIIKVLDFGLARHLFSVDAPASSDLGALSTITAEGVLVGTPLYLSPEYLRREAVDGRADQFAWGVMAYELLSGAPPWKAPDTLALLSQILSGQVTKLRDLVAGVPPEVDAAVLRALAKTADERFASMDDVADAIEPFAETALSAGRAALEGAAFARSGSPGLRGVPTPSDMGRGAAFAGPAGEMLSTLESSVTKPIPIPSAPRPVGSKERSGLRWGIGAAVGLLAAGGIGIASVLGLIRSASPTPPEGAKAAAPLVVSALACGDASLSGSLASPELARAVGLSACARLASELGIDFGVPGESQKVEVTASVEPEHAKVTLSVGDRRITAEGPTPLDAITVAIPTLATQVTAPPLTDAQIQGFGAKDAESARQIRRTWYRIQIGAPIDPEREIKQLIEADPASPFPCFLQAWVTSYGSGAHSAAIDEALKRIDKLPRARANGLRGALLLSRSVDPASADVREGLRLLRLAYSESPEDPDIAILYASRTHRFATEAPGVLDRLYQRSPSRSVAVFTEILGFAAERGGDKGQQDFERLKAVLPEAAAAEVAVEFLLQNDRLEDAKAALKLGQTLGLDGASADTAVATKVNAHLALATFQPEEARQIAAKLLGDPRDTVAKVGAHISIAAAAMQGRIGDVEVELINEAERQRGLGDAMAATDYLLAEARLRRWLDRRAPGMERFAWLEKIYADNPERIPWLTAMTFTELPFLRGVFDRKVRVEGEKRLAAIEQLAERASQGKRNLRDSITLLSLPLVRAIRGNGEAARRWQEADQAMSRPRRLVALDAALALEALGRRDGAEKAYQLAKAPNSALHDPFQAMAAHVRLAALYRVQGRKAEAAALDAVVDRVWAQADVGVREAVLKMR